MMKKREDKLGIICKGCGQLLGIKRGVHPTPAVAVVCENCGITTGEYVEGYLAYSAAAEGLMYRNKKEIKVKCEICDTWNKTKVNDVKYGDAPVSDYEGYSYFCRKCNHRIMKVWNKNELLHPM